MRDGAGGGGEPDYEQGGGGGLVRTLAKEVDENRDSQDGTTPAQRSQAQPDQQPGGDGESNHGLGHAAGRAAGSHDGQAGPGPGKHAAGEVDHVPAVAGEQCGGPGGSVA